MVRDQWLNACGNSSYALGTTIAIAAIVLLIWEDQLRFLMEPSSLGQALQRAGGVRSRRHSTAAHAG
jgi:hypothetical protein